MKQQCHVHAHAVLVIFVTCATTFMRPAPITVAGTLDTDFNPAGLTIQANGSSVDLGGYAGSLIIDLGGNDYGQSVDVCNFVAQGDRIIIGGRTSTGPNPNNFALVTLTSTGLLDSSFNPSGLTIQADGSSVDLGGYAGSLIIDLGGDDRAFSADAFSFTTQGDRIIIGGRTSTGPNPNNFALVALTSTGLLDCSFNPSGLTILADGSSVDLGGYAGSLIIDLGGDDYAYTADSFNFAVQGDRIILGGRTNTGPPGSAFNFALAVLTSTGLLDSSFNPSGFTILADGSSVDLGGYAGSLIIDLGGFDYAYSADSFNFSTQGDRILIGGVTTTGTVGYLRNMALIVLTPTGSLDSSFNPSGLTITSTGASVDRGGYAGSLIINLGEGDFAYSVDSFNFIAQGDRIILGGLTTAGSASDNFALVVLTPTGLLDPSFNPSGLTITSTGASVDLGGYAGSLIIDLGGEENCRSVDVVRFEAQEDRILLGGFTNTGPGSPGFDFALVVLTPTGLLDPSFNPSGLSITKTGASVFQGGYPGSLIIDLGGGAGIGGDYALSVDTFNCASQGDCIILGGRTSTGPNPSNFALVALHGSTRFPPPPPPPPAENFIRALINKYTGFCATHMQS